MYYRLKLYYNTLGTFEPIGELTICSKGHIQSTIRKFSKKTHISNSSSNLFFETPSTLKVIIDYKSGWA